MYELTETKLPGVVVLTPKSFDDERGVFFESFSQKSLEELGIDFHVVQENHIMNKCKGVIRGLHFQNNPHAQAKLVRCIEGVVDDVAVDLRKGSPTYLKWVMVELSAENKRQLFIPRGFAHGVISRTEISKIQYVVDNPYAPADDRSIVFDDKEIGVDWKDDNPVLSEKDMKAPLLKDSDCNFVY